jgi:hypothetical protein
MTDATVVAHGLWKSYETGPVRVDALRGVDAGELVIDGTPLAAMSDRERTDYRASWASG